MNISLSYNWIKEHLPTKLSAEEFARELSLHGPSVERVRSAGGELGWIVVGRIVDVVPHPNANKLQIVRVDIGKEVVEVVCGGSNVRGGMKVALALPGARVRWHGEGELVELKPTEIRGVRSHGMICASGEIGLGDQYPNKDREIMDLSSVAAKPGTLLATALGLDDVIFDLEVTTNRVDAYSVLGIAREGAAILGVKIKGEENKRDFLPLRSRGRIKVGDLDIAIRSKLCSGYVGALVRGVSVRPSPDWMQRRLLASGVRPINNIVDITNYVMLETGQPMHAFDAKKIGKIEVRMAHEGESIVALDGRTYKLDPSMLVIASDRPVAIAGVIGGEATGVTEKTSDIIFEAALFDPVSVRKTARTLGIRTESSTRFEKGLWESAPTAMARALELAKEVAGGDVIEVKEVWTKRQRPTTVKFDAARVADRIGVGLPAKQIKDLLGRLGFAVTGTKTMTAKVPPWRATDVTGEHDIIEEVARLYGYHKIPGRLPAGQLPSRPDDPDILIEDEIKEFFRGAGFTEVISISMIPEAWTKLPGAVEENVTRIANPLSEDQAVLRRHIVVSHLDILGKNAPEFPSAMIFETARVFRLPDQPLVLAGAVMGASSNGEMFYKAKGVVEALFDRLGVHAHFVPIPPPKDGEASFAHPGRIVKIEIDGHDVGRLGEIHPQIVRRFDIPHAVASFELDVEPLIAARAVRPFEPIPEFPPVKRDIAFVVPDRTTYADLMNFFDNADPLLVEAELFDTFKNSRAFHLTYRAEGRTLTSEEADRAHAKISRALEKKFNVTIRS